MIDVHPSQVVTCDELSIRWSKNDRLATYSPFDLVVDYEFDLSWQTKEVVPAGELFPRTEKLSLRGKLDLTVLTNIEFEISEDVWIELGIPTRFLEDGDRLMWLRRGKFLVLNDVSSLQPNGLIQHQYSLLGQGAMVMELVQVPQIFSTYWGSIGPIELDFPSFIDGGFSSIELIKIF